MADLLRLIGAPGTNKVMAGELSRLARRALGQLPPAPHKDAGSIALPFEPRLAHLAVWYHRTSSRVLWQVLDSGARRLEPLYHDLRAQLAAHAGGWYFDGARISVRVRNVAAFAAGERQIVGAVKNALVDGAAARGARLRVDPEAPDVLVDVRMHGDRVAVSIDLAGGPMNKRGYRVAGGEAPLRETMAAAVVMLARHDPRREPLLDPMAGSATIAIEAALLARAAPVWVPPRRPALARLPAFSGIDPSPALPLFGDTTPRIVAIELEPRAVAAARDNVRAAGVDDCVRVEHGDFRTLGAKRVAAVFGTTEPGLILSNPPYGERIGGPDVTQLYADLGRWLRELPDWRAGFIVANPAFEAAIGLRARVRKPLNARPLRGAFYLFD